MQLTAERRDVLVDMQSHPAPAQVRMVLDTIGAIVRDMPGDDQAAKLARLMVYLMASAIDVPADSVVSQGSSLPSHRRAPPRVAFEPQGRSLRWNTLEVEVRGCQSVARMEPDATDCGCPRAGASSANGAGIGGSAGPRPSRRMVRWPRDPGGVTALPLAPYAPWIRVVAPHVGLHSERLRSYPLAQPAYGWQRAQLSPSMVAPNPAARPRANPEDDRYAAATGC